MFWKRNENKFVGKSYDITIFQTPVFGQNKGYKQVYRLNINGRAHNEAIQKVFSMFNVPDTMPKDFSARFISTGDILLIDEGRKGQTYYKLQSEGWFKINRVHVC